MPTPEQLARERIDTLLTAAGWTLQDRDQFGRNAVLGVSVREFPLPSCGCADGDERGGRVAAEPVA